MRSIQQLLDIYGESHQNSTNKLIHWVCVPAIFFSLVGLLFSIPLTSSVEKTMWLNLGTPALIAALVYYFLLSKPMTIGFVLWGLFCLWGNGVIFRLVDFSNSTLALVSFGIFAVAWVFQFVGHKIEGRKPSFLEDLQFLLIGPAWLMSFILKKLKVKY